MGSEMCIRDRDKSVTIFLRDSIIFSSWIPLQKHIQRYYDDEKQVTIDITETKLVDSRIMSKIEEWQKKFNEKGLELAIKARLSSIDE